MVAKYFGLKKEVNIGKVTEKKTNQRYSAADLIFSRADFK